MSLFVIFEDRTLTLQLLWWRFIMLFVQLMVRRNACWCFLSVITIPAKIRMLFISILTAFDKSVPSSIALCAAIYAGLLPS